MHIIQTVETTPWTNEHPYTYNTSGTANSRGGVQTTLRFYNFCSIATNPHTTELDKTEKDDMMETGHGGIQVKELDQLLPCWM